MAEYQEEHTPCTMCPFNYQLIALAGCMIPIPQSERCTAYEAYAHANMVIPDGRKVKFECVLGGILIVSNNKKGGS